MSNCQFAYPLSTKHIYVACFPRKDVCKQEDTHSPPTQVLFSFILDVLVLKHEPSLLSVAGSSLVAAGVLFVALSSGKLAKGGRGDSSATDSESAAGGACDDAGASRAAAAGGVYQIVVDAAAGDRRDTVDVTEDLLQEPLLARRGLEG